MISKFRNYANINLNKILSPKKVIQMISYWPPYLGAGIKVSFVDDKCTHVKVEMKQQRFNTNYVGTHFGGNLYSMCDPFYMFILMAQLGKDFIVWDQEATIKFLKPGKGKVTASFHIGENEISLIRQQALSGETLRPKFKTYIYDQEGDKVALVNKTLYIRKKDKK